MQPDAPVTIFGPDFPFAYDDWISNPAGLGRVPDDALGAEVAIIGAGIVGTATAHALLDEGHEVLMTMTWRRSACRPMSSSAVPA